MILLINRLLVVLFVLSTGFAIPCLASDQTLFLNKLFSSAREDDQITIPPGVWRYSSVLRASVSGTTIKGPGAVLFASNPDESALIISAKGVTLDGITFMTAPPIKRSARTHTARIVVFSDDVVVQNNVVVGGASAGIYIEGGDRTLVRRNLILHTKADGIHATGGASHGHVVGNVVMGAQDDGIATVTYKPDKLVYDWVIRGNAVIDGMWGRGIGVIGSQSITVVANYIRGIRKGAGVLVAEDGAFKTPPASNVRIIKNTIVDVQTLPTPLDTRPRSHQAAIDLLASDKTTGVRDVFVVDNTIDGAAFQGIRLLENVCDITLSGNRLTRIAGTPIMVREPHCSRPLRNFAGNTVDGVLVNHAKHVLQK